MVTSKVNLEKLADKLGYESICWDVENDCWVGHGSSNPVDRSRDGEQGFLVADSDAALEQVAKLEECLWTAADFVDSCEFPIVFFAGVGAPAGESIAMLEETVLPFELDEVIGEIDTENGIFNACDFDDCCDHNGNTVYKIQVYSNESEWTEQNDEYNAEQIELAKVIDGEYEDCGSFDSIEEAKASIIEDGDYVASRGDERWQWGFRADGGVISEMQPEMM